MPAVLLNPPPSPPRGSMGPQEEPGQSSAQAAASHGQRQSSGKTARRKAYHAIMDFATRQSIERPLLFSYFVPYLFFSLLPLVLFVSFTASVALFALVAAVLFTLFWVGVAMLFLVPTLFVSGGVALLVWLWLCAVLLIGRWVVNLLPGSSESNDHAVTPNRPPSGRAQPRPSPGHAVTLNSPPGPSGHAGTPNRPPVPCGHEHCQSPCGQEKPQPSSGQKGKKTHTSGAQTGGNPELRHASVKSENEDDTAKSENEDETVESEKGGDAGRASIHAVLT